MDKSKVIASGYEIELSEACKEIVEYARNNLKKQSPSVMIEAPPGLIQFLSIVKQNLAECTAKYNLKTKTLIRIDPAYGSCDIGLDYALHSSIDIIVHIGHARYPYQYVVNNQYLDLESLERVAKVRIIFVKAEYIGGIRDYIGDLLAALRENNIKRTAIGFTAQHTKLAEKIATELSRKNIRVLARSIVLGCHYYGITKFSKEVDGFIVISGGVFHPLGLGLATRAEKPILHLDPYSPKITDIRGEVERLLKKRYLTILKALDAQSFAIIVGFKLGQYRPWIVNHLIRLASMRRKKVSLLASNIINREYLDNLNPYDYDAYIITSCPRIAIDDLGDYWKPVLTPGEARMVLTKKLENYLFPW
ncbi:MAG: diphthamide biosynthesis enzyme Dph2 [Pyrodictiaceae archaeon]